METKRIIWADSLKGWLILLVVLGHAIQYTIGANCHSSHIWNIIYSFHMSAFMAVSGYVTFRPAESGGGILLYVNTIKRRFRQLLIPFFIWTFFVILLNFTLSWDVIISRIIYPDRGMGLWFLWVLFFISLIFISGSWLSSIIMIRQEYIVMSICLFLIAIMVGWEPRLFGFQFIAYYFLFYSFGYYIHKYREKVITNNLVLIVILSVIWFVLAWFWNMHELPYWLRLVPLPISMMQYAYRFITAAIAIYVLFSASPLLLNNDNAMNKPVVKLGILSLGIYTTHLLLIRRIVAFCRELNMSESMVIISSFIIASLVSWLIVWLISKHKMTAKYFLGKI